MSPQLSDRISQQHRICHGLHGRAVAGVTTQQLMSQLCTQAFQGATAFAHKLFKAPQLLHTSFSRRHSFYTQAFQGTQAFSRFSSLLTSFLHSSPLKVHPLFSQVQGSFLYSIEGSFTSLQKVQDASALSQMRGQKARLH
jgi:hypothetical protein